MVLDPGEVLEHPAEGHHTRVQRGAQLVIGQAGALPGERRPLVVQKPK